VPSARTQLGRGTVGTKIKKVFVAILATGIVVAIAAALGAVLWAWMSYVGYLFALLILVFGIHGALTGKVAPCPFCGGTLGAETGEDDLVVEDEAKPVWCKHCGEYATLEKGELRAHEPTQVTEEPTFKSHVFQKGVWPEGCVLCGAPPVRTDKLSTTNVSGAALLVGSISVSSGKVSGVPYCGEHKDAVKLSVDDEKLQLTWRSLPMLRQYLAANRQAGNQRLEK
jgi:hypothetical protein